MHAEILIIGAGPDGLSAAKAAKNPAISPQVKSGENFAQTAPDIYFAIVFAYCPIFLS